MAKLDLRAVEKITGTFVVKRYQRGYRWRKQEVESLLNDIWKSALASKCAARYHLQPVVVKPIGEREWELIDGQQRLTTIYLIFSYLKLAELKKVEHAYSFRYETRRESQECLDGVGRYIQRSAVNIDCFYFEQAYECINDWFGKLRADLSSMGSDHTFQVAVDDFYRYLVKMVNVIWYEEPDVSPAELFTRLNIGRIPLNDAELVKALLLQNGRNRSDHTDRSHEFVAHWDSIERDLRRPDVWAFISGAGTEESPTRISLLLDTLADSLPDKPDGRVQTQYYTFDRLRDAMESCPPVPIWDKVVELHALVLGWFEDHDLYHKVGYLIAVGHKFGDLVKLAKERTKTDFKSELDRRIRDSLNLSESSVRELRYGTDAQRKESERLLILVNVETVRGLNNASDRYSFRSHKERAWSLEHIHAQQAESPRNAEERRDWLWLHRKALVTVPAEDAARRKAVITRLDAVQSDISGHAFQDLAAEVLKELSRPEENSVYDVDSITNLALLERGDNSALGNAAFAVKRDLILKLDREGAYIPICTRRVFLKYYADPESLQIHFWGPEDRKRYLDAIVKIVGRYLKPEDK